MTGVVPGNIPCLFATQAIVAAPPRLSSVPPEDESKNGSTPGPGRVRVVPLYSPTPISQAAPSSMRYGYQAPMTAPAAVHVLNGATAAPSVTAPVPVVAVWTFARFKSIYI